MRIRTGKEKILSSLANAAGAASGTAGRGTDMHIVLIISRLPRQGDIDVSVALIDRQRGRRNNSVGERGLRYGPGRQTGEQRKAQQRRGKAAPQMAGKWTRARLGAGGRKTEAVGGRTGPARGGLPAGGGRRLRRGCRKAEAAPRAGRTHGRRSGDPAIRRSGDPAIRRSGDPAIRRSGDPAIRRSGDYSGSVKRICQPRNADDADGVDGRHQRRPDPARKSRHDLLQSLDCDGHAAEA